MKRDWTTILSNHKPSPPHIFKKRTKMMAGKKPHCKANSMIQYQGRHIAPLIHRLRCFSNASKLFSLLVSTKDAGDTCCTGRYPLFVNACASAKSSVTERETCPKPPTSSYACLLTSMLLPIAVTLCPRSERPFTIPRVTHQSRLCIQAKPVEGRTVVIPVTSPKDGRKARTISLTQFSFTVQSASVKSNNSPSANLAI